MDPEYLELQEMREDEARDAARSMTYRGSHPDQTRQPIQDGPDPLIEHLIEQESTWINAGSKGRCVVCSEAYQKGDRVLFFPVTETNLNSAVACRQCGDLITT